MKNHSNEEISDEELQKMILELDPPHGLQTQVRDVELKKKEIDYFVNYNNPKGLHYESNRSKLYEELNVLEGVLSKFRGKYDRILNILKNKGPIEVKTLDDQIYALKHYIDRSSGYQEGHIVYDRGLIDSWYILLKDENQLDKSLWVDA